AFKSQARDNVFNVEADHAIPDTVTKVVAGPAKFFVQNATAVRANGNITVTGTLKNTGGNVAKGAMILSFCLALLAGRTAACQTITFDLSPNQSIVHPGDQVAFFATVSNPGSVDVTLDSLTATFLPDLVRDEDFTPFFDNFAGLLAVGQTLPSS